MAWNPRVSPYDDALAYQSLTNPGIGNFFNHENRWRSMTDGTLGRDGASPSQYGGENITQEMANRYRDMAGYTYRGDDGKVYMIAGNARSVAPDQEGADNANYDILFGGASGKGRAPGEMAYSTTQFKPDWGGDMGAYNGSNFDFYDSKGRFVGGQTPTMMGDDQMMKTGAMIAAMVASAGLGGAALAGGSGGIGAGMAGTMNPVLAADAAGLGAGGLGSAGAAGLGGAGAASGVAGNGAFLGEGIESGVPAWDGAAGGSAGGFGTTPLAGVPAPTAPGYGAPASAAAGGVGTPGMLSNELFSLPGIGGVTGSNLLQFGMPLIGALSGAQGQQQSATQTRELPEFMQGAVAGPGGLVNQASWLMNQQMNQPGLLRPATKRKDIRAKRGLL